MRLSVKTKLAGAFGVVIVLTGVVGAVGFLKLSALNATIDELVSHRVQMQRLAEELSIHTLKGIRAEKNAIISSDEVEMNGLGKVIQAERALTHDVFAKLNALADPTSVDLLKKIGEVVATYEGVQDRTFAFTMLNSNYRAHDAANKLEAARGKMLGSLNALATASQDPAMIRALNHVGSTFRELWNDTQTSITAGTMSELGDLNKQIEGDKSDLAKALVAARALITSKGGPGLATLDTVSDLAKANDDVVTVNNGAGNIKAGDLSGSDGAKVSNELMASIGELVNHVSAQVEDDRSGATASYEEARTILIAIILAAIVVAIGAGVWIGISISRGLGKAVGLANAVAVGDLSQSIHVNNDDEVGDLVTALNWMVDNLKATSTVADSIASGDLTVDAKRLSDKDTLGMALEQMLEKLRQFVADALSASSNVASGSEQLLSSATQLSQGATEQASAAEEASASMDEMAANVKAERG